MPCIYQFADRDVRSETLTKFTPTSTLLSTCHGIRARRWLKICRDWDSGTASSAPSGLKVKTAWSSTEEAKITNEGLKRIHLPHSRSYVLTVNHARVRMLREKPYDQKEAEAAIGLRTDNGKSTQVEEVARGGNVTHAEEAGHLQTSTV